MTMAVPVQEFQIGQRVRPHGERQFAITAVSFDGDRFHYAEFLGLDTWHFAFELTLCLERPPYVPSEWLVVGHRVTILRYQTEIYRCETDAEMADRHAVERAQYDAQGDET